MDQQARGDSGEQGIVAGGGVAPRPMALSRRSVVLAGLGLMLGGCATSGSADRLAGSLPSVPWDAERIVPPPGGPAATAAAPTPAAAGGAAVSIAGIQPRAAWGAGPPRMTSINPMAPIRWITIHHDGVSYRGRTMAQARTRLQQIQAFHQNTRNWADIGYHFAIDPQGVVWQGRELRWQGAHVGGANEGNVGVMLLGNFEEQGPSLSQVASLQRMVVTLQQRFRVPRSGVRTHREWPSASTECPGRLLQARVQDLRHEHRFG
jgi:hypothetical protein